MSGADEKRWWPSTLDDVRHPSGSRNPHTVTRQELMARFASLDQPKIGELGLLAHNSCGPFQSRHLLVPVATGADDTDDKKDGGDASGSSRKRKATATDDDDDAVAVRQPGLALARLAASHLLHCS